MTLPGSLAGGVLLRAKNKGDDNAVLDGDTPSKIPRRPDTETPSSRHQEREVAHGDEVLTMGPGALLASPGRAGAEDAVNG